MAQRSVPSSYYNGLDLVQLPSSQPAVIDSHVAADTIFNFIKNFWKALNRVFNE